MHKDNTLAKFGVTNFTDLTESEFQTQHLNPVVGRLLKLTGNANKTVDLNRYRLTFYDYSANTNFSELPQRIDW